MSQTRKVQGISMTMTNKEQLELIAKARELLVRRIAYEQKDLQSWKDACDSAPYASTRQRGQVMVELATERLNLAVTHLAEMDGLQEHISRLEKHPMPSLEEILEDQRHKLLTKAKRLLGISK